MEGSLHRRAVRSGRRGSMTTAWRVTVLRGGPSAEREVSLAGGAAVAAACRRLGYQVTEADILPDQLRALEEPADVIFPVLHGEFGEDGQLQAILESRGLCYVGSGPEASRLAMDKLASKQRWEAVGLPTAPWIRVDAHSDPAQLDRFGAPAVVKPVREGSSIGVAICDSIEALRNGVRQAVARHGQVLVERRLDGPELTVGILEHQALPVIEIRSALGFYDFRAKYHRDDTQYLFEPDIDAATYQQAQSVALEAFRSLGCRHLGRVDMIADRRRGLQLLEINTLPGFTDHSLLPKAAARVGIDFDHLVERLVHAALKRRPR
ncbi:MAG TPA: D-alanine--D-alanine ligase [Planctomycetaceae bacterium]|nr:D-alanine--D-alanine ligase [Planctomycetaceae bacterium]